MKISRPNNWVWHQHYAGASPHNNEKGTGYVITAGDPEAENRVQKVRDVVREVTGYQAPTVKQPPGF